MNPKESLLAKLNNVTEDTSRHRFRRRSRTVSRRKLERELKKNPLKVVPHWRPQTRADCSEVPRPCPYVSCRYNLYLDVTYNGSIQFNFPDREPHEMAESCALDAADNGGMTLNEIGDRLDITRERVRQIEAGVAPVFKRFLRIWDEP